MKTPNRKARSAAQVAMSKTNPSEPDEPRAPKPPVDLRPRWTVLSGSIGPICVNCHQGIRSHFEGYCEPPPESLDEQQEVVGVDVQESGMHTSQHPLQSADIRANETEAMNEIAKDFGPIQELEPLSGSSIVDQALEIINLLPDCPEREILLRRCALAVSHQMNIAGFMLEEEIQP